MSGIGKTKEDQFIDFLNVKIRTPVAYQLAGHTSGVRAISSNDKIIASGGYDGSIIIWDLISGDFIKSYTQNTTSIEGIIIDGDEVTAFFEANSFIQFNHETNEITETTNWSHHDFSKFHKLSYSKNYKLTLGRAGGPPRARSYVSISTYNPVQNKENFPETPLKDVSPESPSPPISSSESPSTPISSSGGPTPPSGWVAPVRASSPNINMLKPVPPSESRGPKIPLANSPFTIKSPYSRMFGIRRFEDEYLEQMGQDNDAETLSRIQKEIENLQDLEDAICAEITRDDKLILIGFDKGIILRYDVKKTRYLPHIKLHNSSVVAIQSLKDDVVISYEINGVHKIWNQMTGHLIDTIEAPSKDDMILFTHGEIPETISFEYGNQDIIKTIVYDQEGEYLFVGMHEGEIQQWKVDSTKEVNEKWPRIVGGEGFIVVYTFF